MNRPVSGATHDKQLPVGRHQLQPVMQGKLVGDAITEVGIIAQPKVRPQAAAEAA